MKQTIRFLIIMMTAFFSRFQASSQVPPEVVNAADTTNFRINQADGWVLINSFVQLQNADSVRLEIIIQHPNNLSWTQNSLVGEIKNLSLRPTQVREVQFLLIADEYVVTIEIDGKVLIRRRNADSLQGEMVILPVMLVFKK